MAFLDEFQHLKIQLEEIKSATDKFADNKVIGTGGFGKVYKGEISHSKGKSMAAFKRLDPTHGQGNTEFWKEIMMLSRYTHENLIALLGYCDEGGEKILVYEHASRGSLDRHLGATTLTWIQRLKICLAVARGLSYLHDHQGTQQRLLHRDIKSANILLDENWNAKISDLGLSKIGPANQQHTLVVSNVVGTPGYCDPLYMEMGFLTKESDVYSFGVVLFEVVCGRLCFGFSNGEQEILVRTWKHKYELKKLDEIIFQDLKKQMDSGSLETFIDIAYQCLQSSREERPTMARVVGKLEMAVEFQEIFEQPMDYEEMIKTAVPPLIYRSKEELDMFLSKGILVNGGKTWFSLNKKGEHIEMISAAECLIPNIYQYSLYPYSSNEISRFAAGSCYKSKQGLFKAHVKARFLSLRITYTINLVFKFSNTTNLNTPMYIALEYQSKGEARSSISYFAYEREDGWMMVELYQFTSDTRDFDIKIRFKGKDYGKSLIVEGIEFRPLEKVEHEVLGDENMDMQAISDSDTDWEQKLPNDYEDIIKLSKDNVQCTTKRELYFLLRQGFLINNGKEWFSLAKNDKKCHMLPARAVLNEDKWRWEPLRTSRFGEVAFNCSSRLSIVCKIKSQMLSPQTTYACYLVYKLPEDHLRFMGAVIATDKDFYFLRSNGIWFIQLVYPQTTVIRPKVDQDTHNPQVRHKMKGLPQLRDDGWMEVQVWEFQTGTTMEMSSMHVNLRGAPRVSLKGLIVQGIEFKPKN